MTEESKSPVSSASRKKVSLLGVDLHMHAQKQGRKVLYFDEWQKIPKETKLQDSCDLRNSSANVWMWVPHCASVSYNSSGYLDARLRAKRFWLDMCKLARTYPDIFYPDIRIPCYLYTCKRSLNFMLYFFPSPDQWPHCVVIADYGLEANFFWHVFFFVFVQFFFFGRVHR